ncbi:MAG: GNAT family N-acetyltransferase [Ignavibacteria bacterium]|nr:GNAT family N-acetyltransferase [Ignavibacteria bacterium]
MDVTKSKINFNNLKIIENYRDNKLLRNEYFNFILKLFPRAEFKEWYLKGFWKDEYNPISVIKNGKIISNVSVAQMNIIADRRYLRGIQIGGVGTLPENRSQGLSRTLMEYAIGKYSNETDIFLLFANETVLEFYPKFGFNRFEEKAFILKSNIPVPNYAARKLDIQNNSDFLLLQDLINNRVEITKIFGAKDYRFITMWNILNIYSDNLYHLKDEDAILIMKKEDRKLNLYEIICRKYFDLDSTLAKVIGSSKINSVKFYFPPDQFKYKYDKTLIEDNGLFVLSNIKLSEDPFKFPVTAIT